MILKVKKINFTVIKVFLEDVNIKNVLVSSKISAGERSYKYFIGCLYNENKINLLLIMLAKIRAYVKSYDG